MQLKRPNSERKIVKFVAANSNSQNFMKKTKVAVKYLMGFLNMTDDERAVQELEENQILAEDVGDDSITVEEGRQVMKQMKNGRHQIITVYHLNLLLGAGGKCIVQQLLKMFNIACRSESVPPES